MGDDWAEDHHDVELVDETGRRLARARWPEGLDGITRLHALIAAHMPDDASMLRAAHAATGRCSLRAVPAVLAYRQPMGRWWLLVPVLLIVALAAAVGWTPVGNGLASRLHGLYPGWMLPDYDVTTTGLSTSVLVTTLMVTLLIDGIVNPTIEELYFRGYLLPRLPVAGWRAVTVSAALFAVQHYWQPYNWLLIFVLQLILTAFVMRSRSVRLGIVTHVLVNSVGVVATLLVVLT